MVLELSTKIRNYLQNKNNKNMLKLPSGAMINKHKDISIEVDHNYLKIDGKILLIKIKDQFIPLKAENLHSHSFCELKEESEASNISKDEKNRMDKITEPFFNLEKPIKLDKSALIFETEEEKANFPETKEYLLLYRTKEEAKA